MEKILLKIQNHKVAIIFAIVLGLVLISPYLVKVRSLGTEFQGIYPVFSDDEIYYQARIQEVLSGNLSLGNAYIKEHQNDAFLHPPLPEWFYALFIKILNISVPAGTILGNLIFPALGFLILYKIFLLLLNNKNYAVFYSALFYLFSLQTFARPISPQFNILFMFLGMYLILKLYTDQSKGFNTKNIYPVLIGFTTGLTLFVSPYYTVALIVLWMLVLLSLLKNKFSDFNFRNQLIRYALGLLPFVVLYVYLAYKASILSGYEESSLRFGLINTHIPGAYLNVFLGLLGGLVVLINRKILSSKDKYIAGIFILSIFILNWQNVLTGQYLQFSSHYLLVTILYILISVGLVHINIRNNLGDSVFPKTFKFLPIILLIIFIGYWQKGEVFKIINDIKSPFNISQIQDQREVLDWLNFNTEENSVIYTLGGEYDQLIPIYTKNNVYYNFYATLFVMKDEETENRWLIQNIFNDNVNLDYIESRQRDFWGNKFLDSYQFNQNRKKIASKLTNSAYIPDEQINSGEIETLLSRHKAFKSQNITEVLQTYEIDFVLLSKDYINFEYAKNKFSEILTNEPVEFNNGDLIYQI